MYNEIIDFIKKGIGKVSLDIVVYVGLGVVGAVLLLGIINAICRKKHRVAGVLRKLVKVICLLFFVFAYFVVSTTYALDFSNLLIYMGYPVAVGLVSYLLYVIFFGHHYCHYVAGNDAVKTKISDEEPTKKDKKAKKEKKQKKEKKEKKEKKQKKEKEPKEKKQGKESKEQKEDKDKGRNDSDEEFAFNFNDEEEPENEHEQEQAEETPMFIVSKVTDDEIEVPITPASLAMAEWAAEKKSEPQKKAEPEKRYETAGKEETEKRYEAARKEEAVSRYEHSRYDAERKYDAGQKSETAKEEDEPVSSISRLAEQIERKRQANIDITDGKRENKFATELFGAGDSETARNSTADTPKVVARKITETVSVKPLETASTGFTAKRITETKTSENTYKGLAVSSSNKTTTGSAVATTNASDSKKKADDILLALEKLRNSMKKS
jgi:hypothetical protein